MFAINSPGLKVMQFVITPASIHILRTYSKRSKAESAIASHVIILLSTKLKIHYGSERARSIYLTLYSNSCKQFNRLLKEFSVLYLVVLEIIKMEIESEMLSFIKTKRRIENASF
ncbi:hypothetical protein CH63R_14578 [Colletotrichum higginsianum IMI 349063]|uniref:Uncharacterized protein n=1 Tax=Colletotrichum higginsianum (strain IMI 349063) TaxID=759273 RepID=A0A1B7XQG0_COLHI|nr:hypothetical protein CH63R_14578 [Colletotrichum higginsianum IMI 349063]OBR02006.1 hypothetical protein CH63R_14578 [Colletotrichum higginsianum IMI 349063]